MQNRCFIPYLPFLIFQEKNKDGSENKHRNYRDRYDETPTHTGGVSKTFLENKREREEHGHRKRGIIQSSGKAEDHKYRREHELTVSADLTYLTTLILRYAKYPLEDR